MNNIDDTAVKMLIHKVGLNNHLRDMIVNKIVNSPYKFTRETIVNLNTEGVDSQEKFDDLKTNFIYKYIGKLHTSYNTLAKHRDHSKKLIKYNHINKNGES